MSNVSPYLLATLISIQWKMHNYSTFREEAQRQQMMALGILQIILE